LFLFVALYGSAGAMSALLGLPLTFGLIGLAVLEMIRGNWWPKKRVLESITGIASALGFLFAVTGWEGSAPSSLTLALISASVICVAFTVAMFLQK